MDYFLYWLDRGEWLVPLQHAAGWLVLTSLLGMSVTSGIVLVARRYERAESGIANNS